MKISVVCCYYKETFLIPIFMEHYESWVDEVILITQRFPDNKMNDQLKADLINDTVRRLKSDWAIVVDADEFVLPNPSRGQPRQILEHEQHTDAIRVQFWRVWRHKTEPDIDRMKPPYGQRRYGEPDHVKPCIFNLSIQWHCHIGMHGLNRLDNKPIKWGQPWVGLHWSNADPCFSLTRTRNDRLNRLSTENIANCWGFKHEWFTPGYLEQLYTKHIEDQPIPF